VEEIERVPGREMTFKLRKGQKSIWIYPLEPGKHKEREFLLVSEKHSPGNTLILFYV
jgi:hypothetical protein